MRAFRVLLAVIVVLIAGYTALVVAEHGMGLLPVFFGDIARMAWPGQFKLDFLGFLVLSGFWLAWRHHFSPQGLALGVRGFFAAPPCSPLISSWPACEPRETRSRCGSGRNVRRLAQASPHSR